MYNQFPKELDRKNSKDNETIHALARMIRAPHNSSVSVQLSLLGTEFGIVTFFHGGIMKQETVSAYRPICTDDALYGLVEILIWG